MTEILPYLISLALAAVLIFIGEARGLFSVDRFPTRNHKYGAYALLTALIVIVTALVAESSRSVPTAEELRNVPFYTIFSMHALLVLFLLGWWALTGRPAVRPFLNIRETNAESVGIGIAVGVGGWAFTIAVALAFAGILAASGMAPTDLKPSPMIPWMAALPLWQKALVVLSAMTVEEAFFRGFLQKRIGLIASTILFAIAHAGYGQPFMLIGVTVVSLVIGVTFYRTRNLVPCIIAHGVFDAIQLFVIVPIALKFMPA